MKSVLGIQLEYKLLEEDAISELLSRVPGWEYCDGMLKKSFRNLDYCHGILFVNSIAFLAEKLNHHPDLEVRYDEVVVAMTTHDVGGLTSYDFELAARINEIV
ncbi:MAG: 4a-hydroxytetrahydrobiopterin dehydratase [Armatimonadetes bacterium]|nr:4a-hydroxytetrahydrobiopterin dehydratase [Armatimonadota bacterium]